MVRNALMSSLMAVAVAAGACGEPEAVESRPSNLFVRAAPPASTFDESMTIELTTSRPAQIYFTTDGSEPTEDPGLRYEGPIRIDSQTLLSFIAVSEDGVWSVPGAELYAKRQTLEVPATQPRLLLVEKDALFFEASPGQTAPITKKVLVRSMGTEGVFVRRVFITKNPRGTGFFDPSSFWLERPFDSRTLAPGESDELEISYLPSDTLRSAVIVVDSDSQRSDGIELVELWGRKLSW